MCEIEFVSSQARLAGSLAVPRGAGAGCAGVVLVGGSGPSDRDNDSFFPPLRHHLLDAGFAVLSYDKRGVGGSSGDWRDGTLSDLATDAKNAVRFLQSQPGVRPDAVGLLGHSEGGWVALRAAAALDDMAWVVTTSCPGVSPAVQERYALANHLRVMHLDSQADADHTLDLYDRLIEAGRSDADFATAMQIVDAAGRPPGLAYYWSDLDERMWGFLKRKQDHDPTADLLGLRCPHLVFLGGADPLVPVAETLDVLGAVACRAARSPDATLTVEVLPGADHRLRLPDATAPEPTYFESLTSWLQRH
ncbi:alpha/beta hydrolase family protein [Streptomyces drozdowiczii]|uniref:Alpha/beta fold hydrolase n=1 Tax=Streptomyces drozdowiczii TaxID=202862 RepID=A0ABY6PKA1_9ACTN|nr:alpha/beta fold hydrolase [Streptomyces drozdowiczii]MCX0241899.1 alpha/beta fold hydrolase [Streptomyces drozdowiczii]UZK52728.1 alpha/beta fold hydrolase [Streptomyces drozdowiczii]